MTALRLDDVTHRAFLGSRELVRATTALADVGIIDTRWFTDSALARGIVIHQAIEAWGRQCALGGVPVDVLPYLDGFTRFLRDCHFTADACERPICDEAHGYAGRYDLLGRMAQTPFDVMDLIDVKTGHAPRWVALQTAGYRRCVVAPRVRRWALELPGDGSYRLLPLNLQRDQRTIDRLKDQQDEAVFLAAVKVARWKRGL